MLKPTVQLTRTRRSGPSRVGTAVVGMGYWGPNLLRVLGDNLDAEVRWICDLDRERLERYQPRHPGARITTRLDRVLADPGVDAVVIATPVHTHYGLVARALAADKHVFVEKPLAPCSELGDELAELAQGHERILMCGQTFLYSPSVRAIKRMVAEGRLGEISYVSSSRVNVDGRGPDVSVISDLGPHDFSILLYWLSEMPVAVRAMGREATGNGIPDVAFVTMRFASGIVANVELSRLAPSRLGRTVLVGSRRMALYDDGSAEPVRLFGRGPVPEMGAAPGPTHGSLRAGDVVAPFIESREPLWLEMQDFISAIRTGRRMGFHTAVARSAVRVVEAAEHSLTQGGHEVALRHDDVAEELAIPARAAVRLPLLVS